VYRGLINSRNTIGEEEKSIQVVGRMPMVVKYILSDEKYLSVDEYNMRAVISSYTMRLMQSGAPFPPLDIIGWSVVAQRVLKDAPSGSANENLSTNSQIKTCISNSLSECKEAQ
jgi:hypothetical protein